MLDIRVGLKHGDESSLCQPISKIDIEPVQREEIRIPTANLIPRGQPGERSTRYDPVESLIATEVLRSRCTVTRVVYIGFYIKSGPLLWARQPGLTPKVPASLGWDGASSDATKCQC